MSIYFKALERVEPGVVGGGQKQFYPAIVRGRAVDLEDFVQEIARYSTANPPDVMIMLRSFVDLLPLHLSKGNTVRLGDLGNLFVTINGTSSETPEDVQRENILKARVIFRPSQKLFKKIRAFEFQKITEQLDGNDQASTV